MNEEQFKPVHVAASIEDAPTSQDKVVFALAQIGEGSAEKITKKLEEMVPTVPAKEVIAEVHNILTELYKKSLISASEQNGELIYKLH